MTKPCQHTRKTIPQTMHIKAEGSQEIVGTATIQVCLECSQVEGTVSNESLFNPMVPVPFTVEPNGDIGVEARKALGL
jgi:hypothetical protein